jgi:lysophospholipase L1-like esterase
VIRRFLDKISGRREKPVLLAMGDSIISDCYPGRGYGVVSLLHRELGEGYQLWGRSRTGFVLADLEEQLPRLRPSPLCEVGLLCVGGNDLLTLEGPPGPDWFGTFAVRYQALLEQLKDRYPRACWLICNLYDPSDGSGQFPGRAERGHPPRPEILELLARLNQVIAKVAGEDLIDLYQACWGHGWSRQLPLWYQMDIEPNREGAAQICRLLMQRLKVRLAHLNKGGL